MARRPKPPRPQRAKRLTMLQRIRSNFLTGLIVVAPIFMTIYLIWLFVSFIDNRVVPLIPARYNPETYLQTDVPGYGVVVFLIVCSVIGMLTKGIFGRQLVRFGESLVDRTPIVRSIYNAVKQIVETIFSQSQNSFQKACLIQYPRHGIWAVAFVSTETRGEVLDRIDDHEQMVSVFLPTTPNPTSGFLLFVPRADVVMLDMSVEDAAKLIISAGLVVPPTAEEIKAGRRVTARQTPKTAA